MSTLVSESMLGRLLESARRKVVMGMASISNPTPEVALQLAADLHTIAGEAASFEVYESLAVPAIPGGTMLRRRSV